MRPTSAARTKTAIGTRSSRERSPVKCWSLARSAARATSLPAFIENTDTNTLDSFVRQAVSEKVSLIVSDEHAAYRNLKDQFEHAFVRHSVGSYVDGVVHTQTIDGFWSLIKRGIMGAYHKVSRKYLPLYVAEFEFRYNNRNNPEIFEAAIARC